MITGLVASATTDSLRWTEGHALLGSYRGTVEAHASTAAVYDASLQWQPAQGEMVERNCCCASIQPPIGSQAFKSIKAPR